jgi:ribonuclease-3
LRLAELPAVTTEPAGLLAARLGIEIDDLSLLDLARVHPSYTPEHHVPSNQRLEFLGDAVLGLVVAEALFVAHPDLDEGGMSKARIALVNESVLAELGRDLELGEHLLLGKGADRSGDRDLDSVLADAMEAIFGAVYLTAGLDEVRRLIIRLLGTRIEAAATEPGSQDFKSRIYEWCQGTLGARPTYEITVSGPDHDPRYVAALKVGGRVLGVGEGRSKKQAEAHAAHAAWGEIHDA